MAFLGGSGDTASTVLELLGVDEYVANQLRIAGGWTNAQRAQDSFSASANRAAQSGNLLMGIGGGIATSAIVMGKALITAAGNMQMIRSGFATTLGSMDAAKSKLAELQKFALTTPFNFGEMAKSGQMLLAMGVSAKDLIPTMKSVGNAVAAAGGNTSDFTHALRAIGQIKTHGFVDQREINELANMGIPAMKILQQELGLTAKQMTNLGGQHISADRAIGALLGGFDKKWGNAMKDAAGNYNNAETNFEDALGQLKATAGESLLPMATEALVGMTALVSKANEFLQLHPDFAKFALTFAAVGGGVMFTVGAFKRLQGMAMLAAQAKKILQGATVADTIAEKEKAGVAGTEGKAIEGAGEAAEGAAAKLKGLAGVKQTVTAAFGGLKALLNQTMVPGAEGGRLAPAFEAMGISPKMLTQIPAFGRAGMPVSVGGMAMGAALGAGAAYGARDDMKAMGASEGTADLYAGITGAVTMGVTAFFPPARAIVAAAELFRLGVDKFYNEPMEKAATEGSIGPEGEKKLEDQRGNKTAQSQTYFDLAEKARGEGDDTSATSFMLTANNLRRQGKKDDAQKERDAAFARAQATTAAQDKAEREKDMLENPEKYTGIDPNASPLTRVAQGLPSNGAYDNAADPPPFSSRLDAAQNGGGMDFAGNYGNDGLSANDYYKRAQAAGAITGDDGGAGYSIQQNRDGTRRVVLDIPRDPNADLAERLKRHNALGTNY